MVSEFHVIGKSVPLIDAPEKVTGRLEYGSDVSLPGMLHGKILRSTLPHARVLHIDTSAAEKLRGVRAVITASDTPLVPYTVPGQKLDDELLLARDKVRYVGDEVAAVAAIDPDIAEEALSLIRVEYEPLPSVLDPLEAMQDGAPLIHEAHGSNVAVHMQFSRGDAEAAFARAAAIWEGRFSTPRVHQAYLEPSAAVAVWDASGRLTLHVPVQTPILVRMTYAKALGVPQDRVRVVQYPMGGAFGGKQDCKIHPICALLARKTGKPVRIVNTRREEFLATLPRMPMIIDMKVAAADDGTLLGKAMRVVADNGAYNNYAPAILVSCLTRHDNLYRIANIQAEGFLVYTNKVPTGPFRGFGNAQGHFAYESALDMLAEKLGMDPAELRLKNASQTGDVTPHGWRLGSCGLSDCIRQATALAGWAEKRGRPGAGRKRRGIGIGCCLHVSGNRSMLPEFDGSSAYIRINEEGKAKVFTSETDLGQGARTVYAQIAAEEMGMPVEDIQVSLVDTDVSPHGLGTFGDRASTLGGNAVRAAAADARKQLAEIAARELEANPQDIVAEAGRLFVAGAPDHAITHAQAARSVSYQQAGAMLVGRGCYVPDGLSMVHPDTKYGNISVAYPFAAQIAEVEVDTLTGEIEILSFTAVHDLGRLLNPMAARGQVLGAVAQGIGYALTEEMKIVDGRLRNPTYERYDIQRAPDMPPVTVEFVESIDPNGPFGAKGLAEPALVPTAPAIANAVYDAIGARITELPITPEKVLAALAQKKAR
ncbi:MAG: xanthine dehydrogenase family protein molybdopterin-binding subunit [Chloroflexi bacterium]|nr:xanthine dehydrogenase family protein molybdopterin-binding subunit [Chloroflexota bacterium]